MMADVAHFTSDDVQKLFEDRNVVVIGDSGVCPQHFMDCANLTECLNFAAISLGNK